jgi:DNA (cytosine-5)-methyltransferase 1
MNSTPLVLSLFPGIGLLDMAFEQEGFCVVRGPDLLWGGDIHRFHPPPGRFDGVIGGPPCKRFSPLANIVRARYGEEALAPDLFPEFERVVGAAAPAWFLCENVAEAPLPVVPGYQVRAMLVDNRHDCGGEQNRVRRFSLGSKDGRALALEWPPPPVAMAWAPAVTANDGGGRRRKPKQGTDGRPIGKQAWSGGHISKTPFPEALRLQGLPADFLADAPLTVEGKREAVGNGVPIPMGRMLARAVRRALVLPVSS